MLPTKFQVNWPFGSEEEVKNRFSKWLSRLPSWIFNRNDFNYFDLQITTMLSDKFQVNWPFGSGEETKKKKISFEDGHLEFGFGSILAIFDLPRCFITKF